MENIQELLARIKPDLEKRGWVIAGTMPTDNPTRVAVIIRDASGWQEIAIYSLRDSEVQK